MDNIFLCIFYSAEFTKLLRTFNDYDIFKGENQLNTATDF